MDQVFSGEAQLITDILPLLPLYSISQLAEQVSSTGNESKKATYSTPNKRLTHLASPEVGSLQFTVETTLTIALLRISSAIESNVSPEPLFC